LVGSAHGARVGANGSAAIGTGLTAATVDAGRSQSAAAAFDAVAVVGFTLVGRAATLAPGALTFDGFLPLVDGTGVFTSAFVEADVAGCCAGAPESTPRLVASRSEEKQLGMEHASGDQAPPWVVG
jgi:hypothetical protein